ncbi:T9SS type A sorting domain-containing protein [Psychroserpens sp. XS_ASV72]|uniref:DUF7619 domain-containing protein n=1 Tax=Psychroserpens sp. XS_ASV72 TaxID=3241293 RepID=UPI003514ECC8
MRSLLLSVLLSFAFLIGNAQTVDIPDGWFEYALLNTSCADFDGDGIADSNVDINNDGLVQISEAESVIGLFLDEIDAMTLEGLQYFTNLRYFEGYFPEIESLDLTAHVYLEELQIYNCFVLNDFNISGLTNLETLTIYGAYVLNELDLTGFVNLENLTCYNLREVTSLDFSELINLVNLTVFEVQSLTSLNFSGLTNLENLDLYGYNDLLIDIDLSGLISLDHLVINLFGELSSLDLSGLINLEFINLNDCTGLPSLDFSDLINLKYAHLSGCSALSAIDLTGIDNLLYLNVSYDDSLTNIDLTELENLSTFNAYSSSFSNLDMSQNYNLESLGLGNSINLQYLNIKNGIEGSTVISNCNNLEFICVDENEFGTIQYLVDFYDIPNCEVNTYCSFTPGGEVYYVEGQNKVDVNADGCNGDDYIYPNMNFGMSNGVDSSTYIADVSGNYSIPVSEGILTLTANLENQNYFSVYPNSLLVNFPSDVSPYIQDFCITPNDVHNDLEVFVLPVNEAIPGFESFYRIVYRNKGNTSLSGTVEFNYGSNSNVIQLLSALPSNDSEIDNVLSWSFSNLAPFESRQINLEFLLNTPTDPLFPLNANDELGFIAKVFPISNDDTPSDNTFEFKQTVVNSFDPNDITCLEGEWIAPEYVGEYVHYLVRFENLGTANAINVVVKNPIDASKFDVNTLIPLDGSHNFYTRINANNDIEFIFENINLPFDDANNDGYVVYKIKTLNSLVLGDEFDNQAEIYFDFNAPVITNEYTTVVSEDGLGVSDYVRNQIKLHPNPVKNILTLKSVKILKKGVVYDMNGRVVYESIFGASENQLDLTALMPGMYFVEVASGNQSDIFKIIKI